jgi:hypothetical protein
MISLAETRRRREKKKRSLAKNAKPAKRKGKTQRDFAQSLEDTKPTKKEEE